jgi:hypothetical protein
MKDELGSLHAIAAPAERIAAEVRGSEVIASEETSARVKGKTWWQRTLGCATAVYHPASVRCKWRRLTDQGNRSRLTGARGGKEYDSWVASMIRSPHVRSAAVTLNS